MRFGYFSKTAISDIRKNYRFFVPRMIAQAGLLAVFYIIFTLKSDERVLALRGGDYLGAFLSIGVAVMMLLSAILMLYTNSFLMKQRKREFGLYHVLGMEKRHVGRILFFESLYGDVFSVIFGIGFGVLLYKLCSLLICRLLQNDIILGFYFINAETLLCSAGFFICLDIFTYIVNRIGIARMKPVELLASRNVGEKEPKVKWLLLILGIASLGGGYWISVTTQNPLAAILLFFVAVILVIIGTYCLFTAGSIFILKALKRNQKYYYNKKHMPAVSGLLYRMKQNAVGLSSICILATGVLVMISTTVSLYAGMEETLNRQFPQHYYVSCDYREYNTEDEDTEFITKSLPVDTVEKILTEAAEKNGLKIKEISQQRYLEVAYKDTDGVLSTDIGGEGLNVSSNLVGFVDYTVLTEKDFIDLGGEVLNLKDDEVAVCPLNVNDGYGRASTEIAGKRFSVVRVLSRFPIQVRMISAVNCYGMVVSDEATLDLIYRDQKQAYAENASNYTNQIAVTYTDVNKLFSVGGQMDRDVNLAMKSAIGTEDGKGYFYGNRDGIWEAKDEIVSMYGSLLFLGLILGFVCLFATALIIYYKQISEGYEDRERFQIMQKIGMSRKEVRKTINAQVLLVFFLPLAAAGVHLIFAFPILEKLLHILMLSSTALFILCSMVTFAVFAGIYTVIYLTTAKTYYKIVQ